MSVINTNVKSLVAQNALTVNNRNLSKTMEQLSTGKRINSAADDAAGLAISNKMTSQVKGLNQAVRNANDGISMLQTAEGATQEITNMLQRMRELAVQSVNGTNSSADRTSLDAEYDQLFAEISRISDKTTWNGMDIMGNGASATSGITTFQVGPAASDSVTGANRRTRSVRPCTGSTARRKKCRPPAPCRAGRHVFHDGVDG